MILNTHLLSSFAFLLIFRWCALVSKTLVNLFELHLTYLKVAI